MCNEHAFRRHGKHDTGILSDGLHIVILCTEVQTFQVTTSFQNITMHTCTLYNNRSRFGLWPKIT